jgi:hypothetical protein
MAIYKTTKGYTLRWYDADGLERQRTYKGITRDEATRLEREMLAARDRGERPVDERHAPTFDAFAQVWGWRNHARGGRRQRWRSTSRF